MNKNDSEFYDLDDPKMVKAWSTLSKLPSFVLKRGMKKFKKDMDNGVEGATGTYYMARDILQLRGIVVKELKK